MVARWQPDRVFRLAQKGVPSPTNEQRGDLFVKVKIQIPTEVTRRQRQLLEEFGRLSGDRSQNPALRLVQAPTLALTAWWRKLFPVKRAPDDE